MKKILITAPLLLLCFIKTESQAAPIGIYLNAGDFIHHRLSYTPLENQRHCIRLHDVFYKPFITIFNWDNTIVLLRDSIFGYRTRDNKACRFFDKCIYTVLNQGAYPLLYKQSYMPGERGTQQISAYYFSK